MIKLLLITIIFLLQGCHNLEHTINKEGYEFRKESERRNSKYNKISNDDVNEQNEQRMIEQCEREEREIRKFKALEQVKTTMTQLDKEILDHQIIVKE